jgi:hypothetical protein
VTLGDVCLVGWKSKQSANGGGIMGLDHLVVEEEVTFCCW